MSLPSLYKYIHTHAHTHLAWFAHAVTEQGQRMQSLHYAVVSLIQISLSAQHRCWVLDL